MELVEGDTLADRIRRAPMAAHEAAALFIQIAEGLGAAHEKGFVHRDLKPANIKISPDGRVKILDFGLAKAMDPVASDVTTVMGDLTAEGSLMGTAAFMSPEQLQGAPLDRRTDVWAFGVCLFEALTGKRPFAGDSLPQVLTAVLKREVDWQALPTEIPAPLRRLLQRCLEKEPRRRLHDIADARLELEEVLRPDQASSEVRPTRCARVPERSDQAGKAPPVAALGPRSPAARRNGGRDGSQLECETERPRSRSRAGSAAGGRVGGRASSEARWGSIERASSRHSHRTAASSCISTGGLLWARRLDALESAPIPGTENGSGPFFSPDSKWVAYFTESELKKVAIDGGRPETLAQVSAGLCGTWGVGRHHRVRPLRADRAVASAGQRRQARAVDRASARARRITTGPRSCRAGRWCCSPTRRSSYELGEAQIVAQSLVTGERKS